MPRFGRPGLIGTAARTAVVVGVAGRMQDRRMARNMAAAEDQQAAAQPAQAAPAAGAGGDDLADKLKELADLKSQGILSDEEFAAAKAKLLA